MDKMLAASSEETGQNSILAKAKITASSSAPAGGGKIPASGIKAMEPAIAGVKKDKFEKAKRETKSPSTERGEKQSGGLLNQEEIDKADSTQGLSQIPLTQTMEGVLEKDELDKQVELDRKKHERALGGDSDDGKNIADLESINKTLQREKGIRRDIEDALDEVRKEQGEQREDLSRATHTISKLAAASLQQAEKSDGVIIFVIRRKRKQLVPTSRHTKTCKSWWWKTRQWCRLQIQAP